MFLEFLTPEIFDWLIIINIIAGLVIAGRRFFKDIRGPAADDAPDWAHSSSNRS